MADSGQLIPSPPPKLSCWWEQPIMPNIMPLPCCNPHQCGLTQLSNSKVACSSRASPGISWGLCHVSQPSLSFSQSCFFFVTHPTSHSTAGQSLGARFSQFPKHKSPPKSLLPEEQPATETTEQNSFLKSHLRKRMIRWLQITGHWKCK